MTNWKSKSHGGRCDHCGSTWDVIEWVNVETHEQHRSCPECEGV